MEKDNKQLLIRDICARLPYGVYVKFKQYNEPLYLSVEDKLAIYNGGELINDLQYLYLRPMSSMTEEESYEWTHTWIMDTTYEKYDWLNKKMFDYRGLIPKGIVLEAPEGMYNTKTE